MAVPTVNDEIVSGDTRTIAITAQDDDGNSLDISNATISYQVAQSIPSSSPVITKDNGTNGGVTITDGPNGKFEISFDASDTADLADTYKHEAQLVGSSGSTVTTLFQGNLVVEADLIT